MKPLNLADQAHAQRYYQSPIDPQRRKLIGVTSVLSEGIPKPLTNWAKKITAEWAVANVDVWRHLEPDAAVDLVKKEADRVRDRAGSKGTIVHRVMECHALGEPPDVTWDDHVLPYIQAGIRFLEDFRPDWLWNEVTVFHPDAGYGGTLDGIARIQGRTYILDYKTSKSVYAETGLQLAAYRYADHAVAEGNGGYVPVPVPDVDGGLVVHLRADGTYQVVPVECGPDELRTFSAALAVARFRKRKDMLGTPLLPSTDDRLDRWKDQLKDRFVALADAGVDVAAGWPLPGVRVSAITNDEQAQAVSNHLTRLEGPDTPFPHDAPDPAPRPVPPEPDPAAVSLPLDSPELVDVATRLERLAVSLSAEDMAELSDEFGARMADAGHTVHRRHFRSGYATAAHVQILLPILDAFDGGAATAPTAA